MVIVGLFEAVLGGKVGLIGLIDPFARELLLLIRLGEVPAINEFLFVFVLILLLCWMEWLYPDTLIIGELDTLTAP